MNTSYSADKPPLILVADDDRSMRMLLRLALEQEGYQVAEAKNGEECIAAYKQHRPELILLDAVMPVMNGFTCCTHLRNLPGSDDTSILMITVLDDPDSVEQAFEVGATDYITKPINWAVLRHRVRRLSQHSLKMRDIASLIQFKQLVCLDSLTKSNQHFFYQFLKQEWRRLAREQAPLSLILCEIDNFNNYKDTYDTQAKESHLQQVGNVIIRVIKRPADLAMHYKEGQFVVILPQTNANGAVHVAQLIRTAVGNLEIADTSSQFRYSTLICGVASAIPNHEFSPEILFTTAEQALEEAKSAAGDRVVKKDVNLSNLDSGREQGTGNREMT